MIPVHFGREAIVKLLLERGATSKDDALIEASVNGHANIVSLLLDSGADVNANINGTTALMWASINGCEANVKLLLDRGADVNAIDEEGKTALMYAKEEKHSEIISILENAILLDNSFQLK